ncbi:MAG: hypothetical protein IJ688_03215 [Treponema sp.]|nr:hypothetical protein [Treponema sp.]
MKKKTFVKQKRIRQVKGIIGIDFLTQFKRVDFDYREKIIEFNNPSFYTSKESDIEFLLDDNIIRKVPIIRIRIFNCEDKAFIDTGSQIPFILRNTDINRELIRNFSKVANSLSITDLNDNNEVKYVDFDIGNLHVNNSQAYNYNDSCIISSGNGRGYVAMFYDIGSPLLCVFGRFQIDYENMKFRVY